MPEWTLRDRLRKAREVTGRNQTEFAELLGVARNTVVRSEHGPTEPGRLLVREWARCSGVSLEWIQTGAAPDMGDTSGAAGEDPAAPRQGELWQGILAG